MQQLVFEQVFQNLVRASMPTNSNIKISNNDKNKKWIWKWVESYLRRAIRSMSSVGTISCCNRGRNLINFSSRIQKIIIIIIKLEFKRRGKEKRTFRIPNSTAVRTLKSSLERYLKTSTSSFILNEKVVRKYVELLQSAQLTMLFFSNASSIRTKTEQWRGSHA